MQRKIENLGILIPSCDKFQDVWPLFFSLFFKYWPENSQNIYLISNFREFKDFSEKNITQIFVGVEKSWSKNMMLALQQIKEEYVLLILEDFLLMEYVDVDKLNRFFLLMQEQKSAYLRLMSNPTPDFSCAVSSEVGLIKKMLPIEHHCK